MTGRGARTRRACAAALVGGGVLGGAGCDGQEVHVFGGYPYDPDGDCLEPASAVEVLEGPEPEACDEVHCWRSPEGDIYVTTSVCEGPPGYEERSEDPEGSPCASALAAHARGQEGRCADST